MTRRVAAIITAITGDRIVIGEDELNHATKEHFSMLPIDILLELIERILKDPTRIFEQEKLNQYHLFYRLDNGKYLVVVALYWTKNKFITRNPLVLSTQNTKVAA
jgi:hypothetical protein